jgi:hypothetical protein
MALRHLTAFLIGLWGAACAFAQSAGPRIGYVYPAGGRQGSQLEIAVGGQRLDGAAAARFSAPGIQATVVEHVRPPAQAQIANLREKLIKLEDRRFAATGIPPTYRTGRAATQPLTRPATKPSWTMGDDLALLEIRSRLAAVPRGGAARSSTPAIADTVILRVTVAPDAPVGRHELRLLAAGGVTNPLVFYVGQQTEYRETDLRDSAALRLPAVLNGQILPGEVDSFRFKARKGQRIVASVSARELVPYIPDAVPGWFQATLALHDARGAELAFADDFRFHPDPVICYKIPADGDYILRVRDALYRGREDFVYRITLGEQPYITQIFPLGGPAGTSVELWGWNLPRLSMVPQVKGPGVHWVSVAREDMASNAAPFVADTLPECMEREPNNSADAAQSVSLPIVINGRIHPEGDTDVFRFDGQQGQRIIAEVIARRLNSPVDSVLRLTDAAGKQLAFNDDHMDKGDGLNTHHADSLLSALLPATGVYYVHLADVQNKSGVEFGYRLRISPPVPDYELRVVPSAINIRPGTLQPITVYALRKDGFAGEIALALKNAPAGFSLAGARVPPEQDKVRLTLTAPSGASRDPLTLGLEGRATIDDRQVLRHAVPAEDMQQAFSYRHLVPAHDWEVFITSRGAGSSTGLAATGQLPVKVPAGATATLRLRGKTSGQLIVDLNDPPEGLTVKSVTMEADGASVILQSDAAKLKPGLEGNLILDASVEFTPAATTENPNPQKQRRALGTLPAVPFAIVAP